MLRLLGVGSLGVGSTANEITTEYLRALNLPSIEPSIDKMFCVPLDTKSVISETLKRAVYLLFVTSGVSANYTK